ncbi:hypothetical protein KAR91_16110 [Candidatus Pacearchaeota archaeon]|nr:hypothetical protein [Candidatus Pacearchaeota archaeon]
MDFIAINDSTSVIQITDLFSQGIPAADQMNLLQLYPLDQLQSSQVLKTLIQNEDLVINDGVNDLTIQEALVILDPYIFGSEFYYSESEGESSTTSEVWQEKVNINTGTIPAGTYKFTWYYEWSFSRFLDPGAGYGVHVNWGAITLHEVDMVPSKYGIYGNGCFYSCGGFGEKELTEGTHKIALNYKANGDASVTYIRRARVTLWRVL